MTNGRSPGKAMLPSPAPLHYVKDSHCSYCGQRFSHDQPWPRQCAKCGNISFVNPIPVVIVLVPVDDGVLVVRRSQEPGSGVLALPGGFVELGETWQEAGARKLREEAAVLADPHTIQEFRVFSAPDDTIIICGRAPALNSTELTPFQPTDEASERKILDQPETLAFPLHTEIITAYFSDQNHSSAHS